MSNKSKLLQLSDDIGVFAESASGFVDNVPATGRFRFRSLLNKLEQQSGELRSSSVGKAVSQHKAETMPAAKLCGDIQATVRDLVTVIQRWARTADHDLLMYLYIQHCILAEHCFEIPLAFVVEEILGFSSVRFLFLLNTNHELFYMSSNLCSYSKLVCCGK